jgi:Peptidase inhibitor family I36
MFSIRKALTTTAVTVAVAGAGLVAASPAQAAGPSNCPSGYVCNYRDINYSVYMTPFQYNIPKYGSYNMHDNVSGVWNNGRSNSARIYVDENYLGKNFLIPRGAGDGNLTDILGVVTVPGFNDSIDSAKFV